MAFSKTTRQAGMGMNGMQMQRRGKEEDFFVSSVFNAKDTAPSPHTQSFLHIDTRPTAISPSPHSLGALPKNKSIKREELSDQTDH